MQNTVRKFRREQEMSQDKLASKAGVSRQTIIKIEKGGGETIPLEMAFNIANALGKPITEIFLPKFVNQAERKRKTG